MKIKRKVEMNLPQLIEWGFGNDIREKSFIANEYVGNHRQEVHFNAAGIPKFSAFVEKSNTFTIEVEEELTEDTEFRRLTCINDNDETVPFSNFTIRELKDFGVKEIHAYIDGEFKCVWRNGKLVV